MEDLRLGRMQTNSSVASNGWLFSGNYPPSSTHRFLSSSRVSLNYLVASRQDMVATDKFSDPCCSENIFGLPNYHFESYPLLFRTINTKNQVHAFSSNRENFSSEITEPSKACSAIAAALEAASSLPVKVLNSEPSMSLISLSSEDFLELCEVQLDVCAGMLAPGDNLTVFLRTPDSYASGLLELQCVTTYPDPHPCATKGESFVLAVDDSGAQLPRTAETALVAHEAVELPERGALVLPLAKGSFVVGLLVAERKIQSLSSKNSPQKQEIKLKRPMWPPPKTLPLPLVKEKQTAPQQGAPGAPNFHQPANNGGSMVPKSIFSNREQLEAAKVAHTLALACVMDQRSLLVQQSAWQRSLLIDGLVDEVRAPLSAFRTLGRMLLPQLKQGELTRDIVDSMITQGDQIKVVFDKLYQAVTVNSTANASRSMEPSTEEKLKLEVKIDYLPPKDASENPIDHREPI